MAPYENKKIVCWAAQPQPPKGNVWLLLQIYAHTETHVLLNEAKNKNKTVKRNITVFKWTMAMPCIVVAQN